ncbi:hypothetical protein EJ05DRAFT_421435, partial [Pseudovirgaria hyperparasitica]
FAHGANDWKLLHRLTVREVSMIQVMDALTDKPEWTRKVSDDAIVDKWRQEARQMPHMSDKAFDWCVLELRDKAKLHDEKKFVHTLDGGSRCVKSDKLVDESLRQQFVSLTQSLIDAPQKDWHPNSNDQVLNMVHPSLYPLVYGRTAVMNTGQVDLIKSLQFSGRGEVAPRQGGPTEELGRRAPLWSKKFQWLPCEVRFTGDAGVDAEITSYINNLHPNKNRPLYKVIEKLISLSIEPWNEVLMKEEQRVPLRILTFGSEFDTEKPDWIDALPYRTDDMKPEEYQRLVDQVKAYLEEPDNPALEEDSNDEHGEWIKEFPDGETWKDELGLGGVADWKWKRVRTVKHPEPSYTYEDWKKGKHAGFMGISDHEFSEFKIQDEFRKKGLQVIVKLASIELTPDKPSYDGGSWHIEGMLNEHIVATSIYYYDVENTTESRISFRQEALLEGGEMDYEQDEHEPLAEIFGTDSLRDEPAVQELGSIATKQGRLLAFPNTLQHCVEPFSLEDKTRPGHRRFIVLWLVDPNYRVVSTANVPPQQYEWVAEKQLELSQVSHRLPRELADMVFEGVMENLMKLDEAKQHRLELMSERTSQSAAIEQGFEEYNFCEH